MSIDRTPIALKLRSALFLLLWPGLLTAEPGLPLPTLRFEASFDLHHGDDGLTEPSALSFDPRTGTLWTVSDDTDAVFQIDQQGRILSILKVTKGLRDPEAVAYDPARNRILVLSEKDAAAEAFASVRAASRLSSHRAISCFRAASSSSAKAASR